MRNFANKFLKYPRGAVFVWRVRRLSFSSSTILSNEFFGVTAAIPSSLAQSPVLILAKINTASQIAQSPLLIVALNVNAELSKQFTFSYELEAASSLSRTFQFGYELELATALTKTFAFSYELEQTTQLSKTVYFSYELETAIALTRPIAFSYELENATALSKPVTFSYQLENAAGLTKAVQFSYELEASLPLTKPVVFSYELETAIALSKPIVFSYELEAAATLSKAISSSYELIASTPLTVTINSSYELAAAIPLSKPFAFSYELEAAAQLSKTIQSSYELIVASPLTNNFNSSYELSVAAQLSNLAAFSYELETATPLTKTIQFSYELIISSPLTKNFQFSYELATGDLSLAIISGYELTPRPQLSRGIVSSYELSVASLSKTLGFSYSIIQNTLNTLLAQAPVLVLSKPVNVPTQIAQTPILVLAIPKRPSQISQTPISVVNKKRTDFELAYLHPQTPVDEIWQFKTTVNKSTQGKEQRMSVRASPRLAVKFDYVLDDIGDLATLKYLHNAMERGRVLYPLHHYGARVLSGAGSNVLTVANRGLAYVAGQSVGMQGLDGRWHVTKVVSFASNVVTIDSIPANPANWQHASLYPMAFARATGELALRLGRGEKTAELEVMIDTGEPLNFAGYSFNQINALTFLDLPFRISGSQNLETSIEPSWRDVGSNAATPFILMSQLETDLSLEFNIKANELQKLGAFLVATRGKLNPFYVAVTNNVFEGCTVLNGDLIASNAMLHDLSMLTDNTFLLLNKTLPVKIFDRFYNYNLQGEIIGATLKTSPQIPANFATSFVQQLVKVRLDTDNISVTHDDSYARIKLKARTLANEL